MDIIYSIYWARNKQMFEEKSTTIVEMITHAEIMTTQET